MSGRALTCRLASALVAMAPSLWAGGAPTISVPPVSQTNYSGDTVTFTVTADGKGPLQYQWTRYGTNLLDGGNISGSSNSSLSLSEITPEDYGTYSVVITSTAGATNASATLTVLSRLVQNGGFETGGFDSWAVTDDTDGCSIQLPYSGYVHSGMHGAKLGPYGALGYLAQAIPTLPGQFYEISFWLKNDGASATNEFALWWEGNLLYDQSNLAVLDWTNMQFRVLATTNNSLLVFGLQNDPSYFGLDDVSVMPVPTCQAVSNGAAGFAFTFDALAGFRYQVQSSTSLFPPSWSNEGDVLFSETNVSTCTSRLTTASCQFYRLVVLP